MNQLKSLRFLKSVSQGELAARIGADQPTVARIEGGLLKNTPRTVRLKRAIAEVLGMDAELLFPDIKSPKPEVPDDDARS